MSWRGLCHVCAFLWRDVCLACMFLPEGRVLPHIVVRIVRDHRIPGTQRERLPHARAVTLRNMSKRFGRTWIGFSPSLLRFSWQSCHYFACTPSSACVWLWARIDSGKHIRAGDRNLICLPAWSVVHFVYECSQYMPQCTKYIIYRVSHM